MRKARGALTPVETARGRGSNSVVVRRYNAQLLMAELRRAGEASKADLARRTNLTQNTVGLIIDVLLADGLVVEVGRRVGSRGQPSTLLALAPDGVLSIGIRLSHGRIAGALVDSTGMVLDQTACGRSRLGPSSDVEDVSALVDRLRGRHRRDGIVGIGLACQGHDRDVASMVRDHLDAPFFVESDGTAATVAELYRGHGRDLRDFVSLTIGDAIGGGVVLDGRYRAGPTDAIGSMPISPGAEIAGDPLAGFGTLLAHASLAGLDERLDLDGATIEDRDRAIQEHPRVIADWLEDCAQALTQPLLSIGAILDLDAIPIDGDLEASLIVRLLGRLRDLTLQAAPEARPPPVLLHGTIGRHGATIGAAILPLHHRFTPDRRSLFGAAA